MVDGSSYQDNRSDIYSLGTTLFHMLSGVPPFNYGGMIEVLNARVKNEPPSLNDFVKNLPQGLSEVIATMMAREQEKRYATAAEAAEDLLLTKNGSTPKLFDTVRSRVNQ
jgi:serine/threonine protein kinase